MFQPPYAGAPVPYPPGAYPTTAPPGAYPPGGYPPGAYPAAGAPPVSIAWLPWLQFTGYPHNIGNHGNRVNIKLI